MPAQTMPLFTADKKFNQMDYGLSANQRKPCPDFEEMLFSQAVTVTWVQEDRYETTHHLKNIISFECMYGFDRLKLRKIALFHLFPPLSAVAFFMRLGLLNANLL